MIINGKSVSDWQRIIGGILRRFARRCPHDYLQDLEQEAWIALLNSKEKFDPAKAAAPSGEIRFSFSYACIFREVQKRLRDEIRYRQQQCGLGNEILLDQDIGLINVDNADMIEYLLQDLAPRQQRLLAEHMIDGLSYRELGKRYGKSHWTIGKEIHRIHAHIQRKINENLRDCRMSDMPS